MSDVSDVHGYQYISISWAGSSASGKTQTYAVTSNTNLGWLGEIKWFGRWRQYTFFPSPDTVYSAGCLRDIADFLDTLRA